jgi:zinc/manganese transport system substrate-binding protein
VKKVVLWSLLLFCLGLWSWAKPLMVVTTLSDYADVVKNIGKDKVKVYHIVLGDQDPHFIRPKPSFISMVRKADVLIATGLDLEMWLPTIVRKAGNTKVFSGHKGYVAASDGVKLLEKPKVISKIEGGLHIYGNPHLTNSPLNMLQMARNIALGLIKNDPQNEKFYRQNLKTYLHKLQVKIFGEKLVSILGGDVLEALARKGRLYDFLNSKEYKGKKLISYLGGWMKEMLPLRGVKIVTYHKNWIYFFKLFGLIEAGNIEPKPGIPPSPRHTIRLKRMMKKEGVKLVMAANYFDERTVQNIAHSVGAVGIMVPQHVGAVPQAKTYIQLIDYLTHKIITAAKKAGVIKK